MSDPLNQKSLDLLRIALQDPHAEFRAGQWEVIEQLVNENAHLLVVQRTGWGKSIVYFIATKLLRDRGTGPTILISPLLALMRNQIAAAERIGLFARTINSSNRNEWNQTFSDLEKGQIDLLIISPERLGNEGFREKLIPIANTVGLFVIDEAHCISDWGHDFRPDYQRILRILQVLPENIPLLATTATANNRVITDIRSQMGNKLGLFRGPLARASLSLQNIVLPQRAERLAWLAEYVPKMPGSGIIYTMTVKDSDRVAQWLQSQGIDARAYSGESESSSREEMEQDLLDNKIKVLVATSALGMGFDKPDLGFVIHYQRPMSIVHYYQQVGRAGRSLSKAYGILFAGEEDQDIVEYFIQTAFPKEEQVVTILEELEKSDDGLSVPMIESRTNLSRSQIEKVFNLISVDTPSPIVKEGHRYYATSMAYAIDTEKIKRLTSLRHDEWRKINDYLKSRSCLMMFLQRELEDDDATSCGRCSVCVGHPLFPEDPPEELIAKARQFLYTNQHVISPRLKWPPGISFSGENWQGRIPEELQANPGRALSSWGDGGWGEVVKAGKHANHFDNKLVDAMRDLIVNQWKPNPMPTWITCVPSLRKKTLVKNFAMALAGTLKIPFVDCIRKIKETDPQKMMKNSFMQVSNLDGAFEIDRDSVMEGPVLLIDDMVDSRWTFTILSAMLQSAGSGPVYPCALTDTQGKDVL
ncbi:RecQ family ATP-dependent DNA helicase [Methanoregula sp.]|uniref:RecQ family ATP-dependent DNA helicase n=1 Tax=Methanoregula sp. TaxID=2052170 RepID=UPI002634FE57|nr:RecQ family ATP-dependent DNA helicase [Methanoregula sp.]MDD5142894.1 RecQ family ATP-dependent DNA helicase [Methanoregula sp.]